MTSNKQNKEFDIVVYGSTGFTGRLVAEYLQQQYGNGNELNWAMAGRSQAKLNEVKATLGLPDSTPTIVADSNDEASMQIMVDRTQVIITTVGPYQLYGEMLVGLCANSGTDYVDLCGESVWMRQMIDAHSEAAKKSGARIVFSCGFDSIPSDLGIYKLQQIAIEQTGSPIKNINGRVRAMSGTFSGGTAESIKASMVAAKSDPEVYKLAIDHFSLVPEFDGVDQPNGDRVYFSEELNSWVAPFVMAAINTRNVHRSNALLGHMYGQGFTYDEMMLTGPGEKGESIANYVAGDKSIAGPDAPKAGEGPSKEEREAGFYDIMYFGETVNGKKMVLGVKGDRDPGYGSTCKLISESAICLIKDASDTPGGIWTTAPAMGNKLIERLEANAGITFTLEI
jgi:short subunit dehydrogenase-like uncharacterized protein